jgi:hypothetical protein
MAKLKYKKCIYNDVEYTILGIEIIKGIEYFKLKNKKYLNWLVNSEYIEKKY